MRQLCKYLLQEFTVDDGMLRARSSERANERVLTWLNCCRAGFLSVFTAAHLSWVLGGKLFAFSGNAREFSLNLFKIGLFLTFSKKAK